MNDVLKRLLGAPDITKSLPTRKIELPRLSTGGDRFILTLRALPYSKAQQLRELSGPDTEIKIILASVVELDRLDPADSDPSSGIMTLEDVLKHKLLPGEITRLVIEIDKLNGYKGNYIREVKN